MLASVGAALSMNNDDGNSYGNGNSQGYDISGWQKALSNGKYDSTGDNDWDNYPMNQSLFWGDFRADYLGHSAQVKIYSPNNQSWIKLKIHKLEETNANGDPVRQISAFPSTNFQWVGPYQTMLGGVNATAIRFFTQLSVGKQTVNFSLTTFLVPKSITIVYGNRTLNITANSFKFNVDISAWPFLSLTDKLRFGVSLLSYRKPQLGAISNYTVQYYNYTKNGDRDDKDDGHHCPQKHLGFGSSLIQAPTFAIADGVAQNITVEVDMDGYAENTLNVNFLLPHYNSTLHYDPVIQSDDATTTTTSGSSSGSILSGGAIFGIVAACCAVVGVSGFFIYRRHKRMNKKVWLLGSVEN